MKKLSLFLIVVSLTSCYSYKSIGFSSGNINLDTTKTYEIFIGNDKVAAQKIRFENSICYFHSRKNSKIEKSVPINQISTISERKISNSKTIGLASLFLLIGILTTVFVVSNKI